MLKMFDPTTFPTAMSGFFLIAATIDVASSGSEVPTATMVSPTIDSDIPMRIATPTAPFTSICPPRKSPPSPMTMYAIERQTGSSRTCASGSAAPPRFARR